MIAEAESAATSIHLPSWVPNAGDMALSLPPGLAARAFGPAWTVAIGAHLILAAVAILAPARLHTPEPAPVRMVFLEPPPPPAAPAGAVGGHGAIVQQPLPEKVEPVAQPESKPVVESRRMRHAAPSVKPKPRPAPQPAPVTVSEAEVPAGSPSDVHQGEAGGVAGGVAGGLAGGVVGGSGSAPIPADQAAHLPQLVHRVEPVYSAEARRLDVRGLVLLEVVLDRDGRVRHDVKVVKSIPRLDDAAVQAVRQWRFQPARDASGRPVPVILEVPLRFVLR